MTNWPAARRPPPVEPPAWYRCFDPEAWRDDKADEQMLSGCTPERFFESRDWRARVRWVGACNAWARSAGFDQLADLRRRVNARRVAAGWEPYEYGE